MIHGQIIENSNNQRFTINLNPPFDVGKVAFSEWAITHKIAGLKGLQIHEVLAEVEKNYKTIRVYYIQKAILNNKKEVYEASPKELIGDWEKLEELERFTQALIAKELNLKKTDQLVIPSKLAPRLNPPIREEDLWNGDQTIQVYKHEIPLVSRKMDKITIKRAIADSWFNQQKQKFEAVKKLKIEVMQSIQEEEARLTNLNVPIPSFLTPDEIQFLEGKGEYGKFDPQNQPFGKSIEAKLIGFYKSLLSFNPVDISIARKVSRNDTGEIIGEGSLYAIYLRLKEFWVSFLRDGQADAHNQSLDVLENRTPVQLIASLKGIQKLATVYKSEISQWIVDKINALLSIERSKEVYIEAMKVIHAKVSAEWDRLYNRFKDQIVEYDIHYLLHDLDVIFHPLSFDLNYFLENQILTEDMFDLPTLREASQK